MHTTLLIFAKYPHPGTVKTRLAATIGNIRATDFYTKVAEHIFRQADAVGEDMQTFICYADARDRVVMNQWLEKIGSNFNLISQSGNDLGERIRNAFSDAFLDESMRSVLIIGTDSPDISPEILRQARHALLTNDLVLGPAVDGGYYLIGMNQFYPSLFDDITWSSPEVAIQTIQKAEELHLKIALLDPLIDIDTLEDLQQWLKFEGTTHNHPLYLLAHQLIAHE